MFITIVSNPVNPTWNERAERRVKAVLATLPVDFERVSVSLEFRLQEDSGDLCHCCTIEARETSGMCHEVAAIDADPQQALERSLRIIVETVMAIFDQAIDQGMSWALSTESNRPTVY